MTKKKIISLMPPVMVDPSLVPASARTFNHVKDGQDYVPEKHTPSRPGAEDALKIKSKGYPT